MNTSHNIGGQAVIEGVMMRSPGTWSVAVRDPKGTIHIRREQLRSLPKPLKWPFVRGVVALAQALVLGIKAIEFSANKAYEGEEEETMTPLAMAVTIGAAFLLGIGLFILLPLYATKLLGYLFAEVVESSLLFNLVDGLIRVGIFLLYVVFIGMWKDMARIFMYHGAEHKVIHAYEEGKDLTLENVRDYSPLHPRCGTSFLMIVMVVSILVFSLIPKAWPFLFKFLSRILLVPVIAGSSYELLKLSDRWHRHPLVHMLVYPGLLLQRLTTREPDEAQLEVALSALTEVLRPEEEHA